MTGGAGRATDVAGGPEQADGMPPRDDVPVTCSSCLAEHDVSIDEGDVWVAAARAFFIAHASCLAQGQLAS